MTGFGRMIRKTNEDPGRRSISRIGFRPTEFFLIAISVVEIFEALS